MGFQLGLGIWTLARLASREQTAMIVTRVCSRPAATAAGSRFIDDLFTSAWLGNTSPRHSACPAMIRVSLSSHRGKAANSSPRRGYAQCQVWVGMCVPHCAYVRAGMCGCASDVRLLSHLVCSHSLLDMMQYAFNHVAYVPQPGMASAPCTWCQIGPSYVVVSTKYLIGETPMSHIQCPLKLHNMLPNTTCIQLALESMLPKSCKTFN